MSQFPHGLTKCYSIKFDVQGSVRLGEEVVETLSHIFGSKYNVISRRSFLPVEDDDYITSTVRLALLCTNVIFCQDDTKQFAEEYVIVQAKGVENILKSLLGDQFKRKVYENQLKLYLEYVRYILKSANNKLTEEGKDSLQNIWLDVIKKISAKFQELASIFVAQYHIESKQSMKDMNHKLILATVIIELKYLHRVCIGHGMCVKSFEYTTALYSILEQFAIMDEDKVRLFIRYLHEELYNMSFYTILSETTAHQLQIILNDMAYSSNVSPKNLLSTLQKVVAARIEFLRTNKDEKLSHDALLVHVILSDMDRMYSIAKPQQFHEFLTNFFQWKQKNINFSKDIKEVLNEIRNGMQQMDEDLRVKLINEVRVLLEMTVDGDY
ncbi:unnamed protein product [Leptidea sinapis]|uniref:Uncharacterized protein n=1 Tax=Leptidea sinapis TaxID=189913 RepID=A0A5E4QNW1_9NEOP|nr:unnamed protein product [Leptidea sinapis]